VSSISASELAECEKKTRVTTSMLIAVAAKNSIAPPTSTVDPGIAEL
jgi:hypothetical protein